MSSVIIWIAAMTSFLPSEQENDANYWETVITHTFSDYTYLVTVDESPYIKGPFDNYTVVNMLTITMDFQSSSLATVNISDFTDETDDGDLDTIATLLKPQVSSKIDYYVVATLSSFTDTRSTADETVTTYSGTNGESQVQDYPSGLVCISPVFISCAITSDDEDALDSISNVYSGLLPNASALNEQTDDFTYGDAEYGVEKITLARYYALDEYKWDYDYNDGFSISGIEDNIESDIGDEYDVECLVSVTACGDDDICMINLPWCIGNETEFDGGSGPIPGTSKGGYGYGVNVLLLMMSAISVFL